MLEYDVLPAGREQADTVLVLLHGRGADRGDLRGLATQLPPEWSVVLPDAPHAGALWGYGPGRAWYRYLGGTRPEPDSFRESLDALEELIEALPEVLGVTARRLVLGGFSQGGTLSLGFALARPGRATHVLNFSGFLADHPEVQPQGGSARGLRVFWGHGFSDPNIPFDYARAGQETLRAAGAQLEARDYPIGHWIDPLEVAHAVAFVETAAA